jgi:hypothetical protein
VHALAVQPQVDGGIAELQGCTATDHQRWAHNQAATCATGNTSDRESTSLSSSRSRHAD